MKNNTYKEHIYALILAGGGGTRLWPKSRNETPKQFLDIFGKKTLTQITAERLRKLLPWDNIFVVTVSQDYKNEIEKELPDIPADNIIVEPARKNTAPAHGLGAAYILKKDKNAVIINAASDHFISPEETYLRDSKVASEVAFSGDWLVSLGITPTYPNTGYGHIKRGKRYQTKKGEFYKVDKFVEKPKLELAKKYTESGNYYWNANQYVWRADTYLNALDKYEPKLGKSIQRIYRSIGTKEENNIIEREYKNIPEKTSNGKDLSVDFAVSERAKNILVLPVNYNWTDIGDWNEVWRNLPKDDMGNVIIDGEVDGGEIINIDTSDALIHKNGRLIAVVDVDNVVVIDTKDAILICSKSKAQNVKKIVNILKDKNKKEYL